MIGPAPSAESYLRIDKIINAMKKTGAQVSKSQEACILVVCLGGSSGLWILE